MTSAQIHSKAAPGKLVPIRGLLGSEYSTTITIVSCLLTTGSGCARVFPVGQPRAKRARGIGVVGRAG
jgi:hypothetical protein